MYYLLEDDPDLRYDSIDEVVEELVTRDNIIEYYGDRFDQYLDEDGEIDIAGYSFAPSRVLFDMNEDAYYDARNDWADNEIDYYYEDASYDLNRLSPGDHAEIMGVMVYAHEEGDEEECEGDTDGDEVVCGSPIDKLRAKIKVIHDTSEEDRQHIAKQETSYFQMLLS